MKYDGPPGITIDDTAGRPPIKKMLALWDDRPRFLGMFSSFHGIPKNPLLKIVGFADHFVTCGCGGHGGQRHPAFLARCVYVKLGASIHTLSWPTWFPL
jgi:hypothetical protein